MKKKKRISEKLEWEMRFKCVFMLMVLEAQSNIKNPDTVEIYEYVAEKMATWTRKHRHLIV